MATFLGAPDKSAWFGSAITILTLATILPFSQAADYWGRKPFIMITTAFGVVGSIVISRSQNIATAIAGFVLVGAAFGCQSICYAIPSEVLHRKYRAYGQAASNIAAGLGAVTGVLAGGALTRTDPEGWRIYWYISAATFAAGLAGIAFGYNPPPRELQVSMTRSQKLRHMDWIGSLLIASGLVLLVMALQWTDNPYKWSDRHILGSFVTGVGLLIAFGLWESKGTSEGVLHHRLFGDRNFPIAIVLLFLEGLGFFTVNNFFVFEITLLNHTEEFSAGLRFAVLFIASIAFAFVVGAYTTWTKQVREPLVVGFLLMTIFGILMVFYRSDLPLANSYGYAVLSGSGLGIVLTNVLVAAQLGTPPDMISLSSGLPIATRSLGGAVGFAINNAIFNSSLQKELPSKIAAAVLPLGFNPKELGALIGAMASQNQAAVGGIPGITPQIIGAAASALEEAYRLSFRKLWIAAAVFSAAGVIGKFDSFCTFQQMLTFMSGSALLWNPKAEFNQNIDAPMEIEGRSNTILSGEKA